MFSQSSLFPIVLYSFIFFTFQIQSSFSQSTGFRDIECSSLAADIIEFRYYHLEKHLKSTGISVGFTFKQKISKPFYMQMTAKVKSGKTFTDVFKTDKMEWCSMMLEGASNPVIKMALDQVRPLAPKMFSKCPYEGDFDIRNITLDNVVIPAANVIYKVYSKASNGDKALIDMSITMEVGNKMLG